jgi:hypothetical protein
MLAQQYGRFSPRWHAALSGKKMNAMHSHFETYVRLAMRGRRSKICRNSEHMTSTKLNHIYPQQPLFQSGFNVFIECLIHSFHPMVHKGRFVYTGGQNTLSNCL